MLLILTSYFLIILIPLTFRLKTKCKVVAISKKGKKIREDYLEHVFEAREGYGFPNFLNVKQATQSIVAFVSVEMIDNC